MNRSTPLNPLICGSRKIVYIDVVIIQQYLEVKIYQKLIFWDCTSASKLVEDKPRTGHPSTSRNENNVQCMRNVLNSNWWISVRMITNHAGIDKMTVRITIIEDFQMWNICVKLVSKVLQKLASWSTTTWPLAKSQRFLSFPTVPVQTRGIFSYSILYPQRKHHGTAAKVLTASTSYMKDIPRV